jgi:hypothetical protein
MRAWRIEYSLVALLAMFGIVTAEPVLLESLHLLVVNHSHSIFKSI